MSTSGLPTLHTGARKIRREATAVAFGALLGGVLNFGPGVSFHGTSSTSVDSAPFTAGIVVEPGFPKAHAESVRHRRRRRRREAERKAAEARQKEADSKLLDHRLAELPANCKYDSIASFSSPSELQVCGGLYYRPYEEDGVKGYQGYPVGADSEEIKEAEARRDKARKKRLAEAEKKLKAQRKTSLDSYCAYDSFASLAAKSPVYACGGVQFMQVEENGVRVYDRRGPGSVSAKTKKVLARRAKARAKGRADAQKKRRAARLATLPKGCTYDSYASFFTSSNVYFCNGIRYRQYNEAGTTSFGRIEL